jgi:hypothetical protein
MSVGAPELDGFGGVCPTGTVDRLDVLPGVARGPLRDSRAEIVWVGVPIQGEGDGRTVTRLTNPEAELDPAGTVVTAVAAALEAAGPVSGPLVARDSTAGPRPAPGSAAGWFGPLAAHPVTRTATSAA